MRISALPFSDPCYFGTDIPSSEQLIAHKRTVDEICKVIGADSLAYLKMEAMKWQNGLSRSVLPSFSGEYPVDPPEEDIRGSYEK